METKYPSRVDVFSKLESLGFKNHADSLRPESWIFYRKMPGTDRHQTVVHFWDMEIHGRRHVSFEVDTTFETAGGIWAQNKYYGLSFEELQEHLDRLEGNLKDSITAMQGNPESYRMDDA